jgi:hypothetical protein
VCNQRVTGSARIDARQKTKVLVFRIFQPAGARSANITCELLKAANVSLMIRLNK